VTGRIVPASGAPPRRSDYPAGDEGYAEFEKASKKFQEDKQEARKEQRYAAAQGTQPLVKMRSGTDVTDQTITPEKQGIHAGGGSRKRRRIAKLSRRIERTLRRVQKKHGLRDDKNSFLRRTLNAKKMK
jgi:hypothetical protein